MLKLVLVPIHLIIKMLLLNLSIVETERLLKRKMQRIVEETMDGFYSAIVLRIYVKKKIADMMILPY